MHDTTVSLPGPLSGYRVVDLTTSMSGPLATMVLADQGADVIKVEAPDGDIIRRIGPGRGGMSGFFANLNRGKRSIVVDLTSEHGRDTLRRLLATADVFVHNLRVGAPERLGIGADEIRREFPRVVYVAISGFGHETSRAEDPVYDQLMQAASGLAARQAGSDGTPQLVRHGIVDKATGLVTAQAIATALLRRARTGAGETVHVSMLDVAVNFLWPDGMANRTCLDDGISEVPDVTGSFRLTPTSDGHVAISTLTDRQFQGMMQAVGLDIDPCLSTIEGRVRFGGEAMRQVRTRLSDLPTADAVDRLRRFGVPCAAVTALDDVATSPAVAEAGVVREVSHPVLGRIVQPRPAARMSGVDDAVRSPAPALGEHTEEICRELGVDVPASG